MARIGRVLTMLLLAALLGACSLSSEPVAEPEPEPEPPTASASLAPALEKMPAQLEEHLLDDAFHRWFDAYVHSRIIELSLNDREAVSFGPWAARQEIGAEDAASDGALTEWATDYYITHNWSDYGQEILSMQPGDTVSVNGRPLVIEEVFNYPKASYYEEIVQIAGENAIVFQTCYPDSDQNRIAYGR